jgi:hypothetical protein
MRELDAFAFAREQDGMLPDDIAAPHGVNANFLRSPFSG